MAKLNWHDRILAYLVEYGYKEIATKSTKYRRFSIRSTDKYRQYVLGRNGNVRRELLDEKGTVVGDTSVTDIFKKYVVRWEQLRQGKGE